MIKTKALSAKPRLKNRQKIGFSDNFLEALRDLGGGIAGSFTEDLAKGLPQEALKQVGIRSKGELKPNQPLNLEKELPEKELPAFKPDFLNLQRQEKLVWSQKEQEIELQIAAILEELKKLVQATKGLSQKVEIASVQAPVEPGVYHLNFFEKLRAVLILLREKIEESATWLNTFNQKAKKRNFYWAQVRKSGMKFMLSQERYMATQAG
jgi:hypothetical protein